MLIGLGFILATIIQLIYWGIIFPKLAFYKDSPPKQTTQAVSIIICAKNEAQNLKKNLPLILNQNYPSFEIIVVNDNS
ncbi:MAG: glycosyltransferase, partial [Bacteroidota bacterium]